MLSGIGLYEAGSVVLGFRMGMIFTCYQILGIVWCRRERFRMSVRVLTAYRPRGSNQLS